MTIGRARRTPPLTSAAVCVAALLLAACSDAADTGNEPSPARLPTRTAGSPTTTQASPSPTRTGPPPPVAVADVLATGLDVPWGIAVAEDGTAYIAERNGRIVRRGTDGRFSTLGEVPGVQRRGEGGLLGLALDPQDPGVLLAYFTTSQDNRVTRIDISAGTLGRIEPILTGIPAGGNHNGGRLLIAPDASLFVATGDAGDRADAQDPESLGGKILRITPTGGVPADNPRSGSPVYSLGHRNVQGLAFDSAGRLWATEFGQNTWDELNLITPGANYGWPDVEGRGGDRRFVDPQVQWGTDESSPSGLAIVDDVAYVAALRGERLWQVDLAGGRAGPARAWLTGELGRLRTVLPAPGAPAGTALWITTSNRDGRGSPSRVDDRLVQLRLG